MSLTRQYAELGKLCILQIRAKEAWWKYRRDNPDVFYDAEERRLWNEALQMRDRVEAVIDDLELHDPNQEAEFNELAVAQGLLASLDDTLDSYNDGASVEPYDLYSYLKDRVAEIQHEIGQVIEKKT